MSRLTRDDRIGCKLYRAHISDELAKDLANGIWQVNYSDFHG